MPDSPQSPVDLETAGQALARLQRSLTALSESAALDAQVLMGHVLGKERAWLLAHPEHPLSTEQRQKLSAAATRLLEGLPLPYVIGEWEFYKLPFYVNSHVLIPRPETELLVDLALDWLRVRDGVLSAIDIGTGSGCIAVSLAVNLPDLLVTAVDISPQALEIAQRNAARHAVSERVRTHQGDLLAGIEGEFDLIAANLPYIPTAELDRLTVAKEEPRLALDGGEDGLDLIRRLLADAPRVLSPGGLLLAEIEAEQGPAAAELGRRHFPDSQIAVIPDLAGRQRILRIEK